MEEESDISESEGEEEASHFQVCEAQVGTEKAFQFTQVESSFDPRIEALFKQSNADRPKDLNLRNVLLLDSQSTMDLFCNRDLVEEIIPSKLQMRVRSNGGAMVTTKKARVPGYNSLVWYSSRAITNIVALKNVINPST